MLSSAKKHIPIGIYCKFIDSLPIEDVTFKECTSTAHLRRNHIRRWLLNANMTAAEALKEQHTIVAAIHYDIFDRSPTPTARCKMGGFLRMIAKEEKKAMLRPTEIRFPVMIIDSMEAVENALELAKTQMGGQGYEGNSTLLKLLMEGLGKQWQEAPERKRTITTWED